MKVHLVKRTGHPEGAIAWSCFVEVLTIIEEPAALQITSPSGEIEYVNFTDGSLVDSRLLIPEGTKIVVVYHLDDNAEN